MKTLRNKSIVTAIAIAFVLMLSLVSTVTAYYPLQKRNCSAFISSSPKLNGLGQTELINAWVVPQAPLTGELNLTTYTGYPFGGVFRYGYKVVVTKPNGNTVTYANMTAYPDGSIYLTVVCDQVGTWTATFSWPTPMDLDALNQPYLDQWYFAPTPASTTWTVQTAPVQITQPTPLPTGYWTRPISSENREWASISGPWLEAVSHNHYTTAPKTAHILWTKQTGLAGIIGGGTEDGWSYSTSYGSGVGPTVEFMGKLYYNVRGGFARVDLRTGEEEWWVGPNSGITCAQILPGGFGTTAVLWGLPSFFAAGATFTEYSADTGAEIATFDTGLPGGSFNVYSDMVNNCFYLSSFPPGFGTAQVEGWLAKWDPARVFGPFSTGIVWNVSVPAGTGPVPDVCDGGMIVIGRQSNRMVGYNATTGAKVWDIWRDQYYGGGPPGKFFQGDGKVYYWYADRMQFEAFNIYTGASVWNSTPCTAPWGAWIGYEPCVSDGKLVDGSYDGYLRAWSTSTGQLAWKVYSGNTTETPYNTWSWFSMPAALAGGGMVFAATTEHSPTQPVTRGYRLYAVDINTGAVKWTISGEFSQNLIAEGYLLATNGYDGLSYCFGKGQTATTISVGPETVANGSSVTISGTVTDQSPGAPGTPAVSDASMSAWMESLYMQKAMPTNATGVPVQLRAIGPTGSVIEIGTVTSDLTGHFSKVWTPPTTGSYTVMAAFGGSDSYWSSWAETALGVGPAPAAAPTVPTADEVATKVTSKLPDNTPLLYGIVVAVVIAILIGLVSLFWKRK